MKRQFRISAKLIKLHVFDFALIHLLVIVNQYLFYDEIHQRANNIDSHLIILLFFIDKIYWTYDKNIFMSFLHQL